MQTAEVNCDKETTSVAQYRQKWNKAPGPLLLFLILDYLRRAYQKKTVKTTNWCLAALYGVSSNLHHNFSTETEKSSHILLLENTVTMLHAIFCGFLNNQSTFVLLTTLYICYCGLKLIFSHWRQTLAFDLFSISLIVFTRSVFNFHYHVLQLACCISNSLIGYQFSSIPFWMIGRFFKNKSTRILRYPNVPLFVFLAVLWEEMFINFAFVVEYIKMAVLYSAICARLTICHIVSLAPSWTNCEV